MLFWTLPELWGYTGCLDLQIALNRFKGIFRFVTTWQFSYHRNRGWTCTYSSSVLAGGQRCRIQSKWNWSYDITLLKKKKKKKTDWAKNKSSHIDVRKLQIRKIILWWNQRKEILIPHYMGKLLTVFRGLIVLKVILLIFTFSSRCIE